MTAHHPVTSGQPAQIFTFICGDCAREQNSATTSLPQGWDLIAMDCSGAQFVRCPDCAEKIEQAHFDRMADFMASNPQPATMGAVFSPTADTVWIGYDPAESGGDKYTLKAPTPSAFHIFLEKQDGGEYRVALMPEAVLMRWLPLGFFLTPAEARATARDLLHYAAQAERPGQLADATGAAA